ncbi:MAG: aspartate-semialdehyde dehydrogenase [Rickettsiaceae bacterium]|nr:aspartate-semialdehyde dehydrogenase [Rickettsiaceae bacterium]
MTKKFNIAVVGATGNVGREITNILAERNFPIDEIHLLASEKSVGKNVSFGDDENLAVENLADFNFTKTDIVFCCASEAITQVVREKIRTSAAVIIDKSSLYRMDNRVPLIVPEVNLDKLTEYKNLNIVASPNCNAIPISIVLKPLEENFGINRAIISTYQAVSGAGKSAMDELYEQTKAKFIFEDLEPKYFPKPIAFNIIPQIGSFELDGYTGEETKIRQELQKILAKNIAISVTSVRVPVFVGHSASINVEFEDEYDIEEIKNSLASAEGIEFLHDFKSYDTPLDIAGSDKVHVSRLRRDSGKNNAINLWVASDNLRKGAGLNAVQIAEELIKKYL